MMSRMAPDDPHAEAAAQQAKRRRREMLVLAAIALLVVGVLALLISDKWMGWFKVDDARRSGVASRPHA